MRRADCEYWIFVGTVCSGLFIAAAILFLFSRPSGSSELLLEVPDYIKCGERECLHYEGGPLGKFGTYSLPYMQRRWERMCDGPARYDAMREANDMGQPQPCSN